MPVYIDATDLKSAELELLKSVQKIVSWISKKNEIGPEVRRVQSTPEFELISNWFCSFYCWREGARADGVSFVCCCCTTVRKTNLGDFVYFALPRLSLTQVN